jgi:copper chaperone CopZ
VSTNDQSADGREYTVKGMTCEHCATSVTEEVEQVPGVAGVDVDLEAGRVVVRGEGFSDQAVREAVDEAGYEVVAS